LNGRGIVGIYYIAEEQTARFQNLDMTTLFVKLLLSSVVLLESISGKKNNVHNYILNISI